MDSKESRSGASNQRIVTGLIFLISGFTAAYHKMIRPLHRTWGATDEEVNMQLPGDEFVLDPADETTRAITVEAPSEDVWPWIVQLGQGRGGFYSYTWLENLARADIHNLDYIDPDLQDLKEGDAIRMAREDYWVKGPITLMTVKRIEPGRTMVLQGHDGGTWTFHVDPVDEETSRFVVRGRKPLPKTQLGYALRYVFYELPHFIMERGMMRGIKARAERSEGATAGPVGET